MNLQEQIYRIQGLMVTEGKEGAIKNMIERMGIVDAVKMVGDYDLIEPYLTDEDKSNIIKEKVKELGRGGVSIRPITYEINGDVVKEINFLGYQRAYINEYYKGSYIGDVRIEYKDLPSDILDKIFRSLINI